ncbi:MAG: aminodeoxychorismate synthase component I [Planctomycetaceae bacterium]|nr:MAG: aminodeoxychorismate synthase component I [Planctomycetaceae bacterium]
MGELPLVEELTPPPEIPVALQAFAGWPSLVLLDSALATAHLGRYSFLTADPVSFTSINRPEFGTDPFANLKRSLERVKTPRVTGLPPFQGGAAGLLSYELGGAWEHVCPAADDGQRIPALAVGLYDWVLAWDHLQGRAWIISQGLPETEPASRLRRAAKRLKEVRHRLGAPHAPTPTAASSARPEGRAVPGIAHHPLAGRPGLVSNFSRTGYLAAVARAIEYIRAGDIFQVNLSQQLCLPLECPPVALYLKLRQRNPAPFGGFFAHDDWVVASSSPERFVQLHAGEVETRPIKGTRQRRSGPEADLFTRDELRQSEKDQAENVMIVDLLRNDLSRVCLPGTVRVPELCRVESYATVQHLVSVVQGRLRPEMSAWDLFSAVFPGGSITGAPKVRAMQIIAELETTQRGPYCGSLFYVSLDGTADSNILIRTICLRNGCAVFPVGGGIVAQSNTADAYTETLHKAAGVLRAFKP